MSAYDYEQRLIEGMVGPENVQLWNNDAEFHAHLTQLARVIIPDLVAGAAMRCRARAERRSADIANIRGGGV